MSAGHREGARMINNLPARSRKGTSKSQPSCWEVRSFVSWLVIQDGHEEAWQIVPSRHFSNSADPSLLGRGLCKSLLAPAPSEYPSAFESFGGETLCVLYQECPFLAPFPSCTPLLGPMPSGAYVSPYWVLLLRGCPWLFTNARPSSTAQSLCSCWVASRSHLLFALKQGGPYALAPTK